MRPWYLLTNRVEVKATGHPCKCLECGKPILKGEVRVNFLVRWFHAQCFVNIVESIPEIETLWKNAAMKNVLARIRGDKEDE
jgi:hypothetical protein